MEDATFETVNVQIRRNADGVVRDYKDKYWLSDFIWSEGNYACDCNRRLFFERAEDYSTPVADLAGDCGHGKYSVRIIDGPATCSIKMTIGIARKRARG